ncbi:hypothetical protein F7725_017718 [Dissostichus mawsoni]|uniref:Receptor ligand binding region domain-containing protein n=1 Tax=Dissostichus mawsoni TaxID=36200 RepID=A0A7J5XPY1_DISMA|nr:hypothetical protein F7725_017718 [Dissostichus mawsoni]
MTPAVRLALNDLERQPPPLGDYELQLHPLHPQVSFSAPPPLLSNRKWYGTFSTLPSDRAVNQAAMRRDLARQLLKADVHVVSSESFSADACSSLRKIRESDARIIVALLDEDSAAEVFCCAYRLQLFGAQYQWLCCWLTEEQTAGGGGGGRLQRRQPADGCRRSHAAAEESAQQLGGAGGLRTGQDSNITTPQQFLRLMTSEGSKVEPLHGYAYDSVWAAAIALTQVMEAGPVFFRNGERMASIELLQFQGLRLINHLLRFKGPAAARDRTLVLEQGLHVGLLMFGIVSSAAALTIIITLTFLLFTLIHRKHACSGCLEELLLLGLLLSSSSVMISGLDGASLSPEVFQTLCSILDPLRREELQHGEQSVSSEQDVVVRPFSETCSSTNMELWTIALCGYKAPLMGLGCFVAWSIRRTECIKRSEFWKVCVKNSEQQKPSETQIETAEEEEQEKEEEEEEEEKDDKKLLIRLNQQLKSHTAQCFFMMETVLSSDNDSSPVFLPDGNCSPCDNDSSPVFLLMETVSPVIMTVLQCFFLMETVLSVIMTVLQCFFLMETVLSSDNDSSPVFLPDGNCSLL